MRQIVGFILILSATTLGFYLVFELERPVDSGLDLSTPSPLLGQTIANALHQAMSDPYLVPFERAVEFLINNPGSAHIELSQFTDWAIDNRFPIFFSFESEIDKFSYDKPTSAWAVDAVKNELYRKPYRKKLEPGVKIVILEIEGKRWWMGAIVVSDGSQTSPQVIGAFFDIDNYLREHIPRFVDKVVLRKRFPLVSFQSSSLSSEITSGQFSIRILDEQNKVYLQRGYNFEPDSLIYAESNWYDNTVVCLNTGWDLQVFSTVPLTLNEKEQMPYRNRLIIMLTMLGLTSAFYWWSKLGKQKNRHI